MGYASRSVLRLALTHYETDYAYDSIGRLFAQALPSPDGTGKVVKITIYDPGTGRMRMSTSTGPTVMI